MIATWKKRTASENPKPTKKEVYYRWDRQPCKQLDPQVIRNSVKVSWVGNNMMFRAKISATLVRENMETYKA